MPKRVILFYPVELDQPPVNWDEDLDIPIEYQPGLPTRPEFWKSIESGTLCVIDDLYDKDGVGSLLSEVLLMRETHPIQGSCKCDSGEYIQSLLKKMQLYCNYHYSKLF